MPKMTISAANRRGVQKKQQGRMNPEIGGRGPTFGGRLIFCLWPWTTPSSTSFANSAVCALADPWQLLLPLLLLICCTVLAADFPCWGSPSLLWLSRPD